MRYIDERLYRVYQKRISARYKRIILEEKALRNASSEMSGLSNDCECQFFTFKSAKKQKI